MERKGRTKACILGLLGIISLWACSKAEYPAYSDIETTSIILQCSGYGTKASVPDEDRINDMNIIIFKNGEIEETIWKDRIQKSGVLEFEIRFVQGQTYTICALANLGKKLIINDYEEWEETISELPDSDGFRHGIPMSACIQDIRLKKGSPVTMELIRMAAKISLRIDRSNLSKDVRLTVKRAVIGNCPRFVSVKGPSKAGSRYDVFEKGFELTEEQCIPLNTNGAYGLSEEISFYMLENMQGDFPDEINKYEDKVLSKDDPLSEKASYIEIEMDYLSSELISYDSPLIYRFYLGEGIRDLNIERNCHYHITVAPEDDGLAGNNWRVDKSGIGPSTPFMKMYPGDYVECNVGDTLHIWCDCYPKTAPFDPGFEELNYDRNRGIYDYKVDDDLHGVTLYPKKPGTGIIYMTAGNPINQSRMVLVCVLP